MNKVQDLKSRVSLVSGGAGFIGNTLVKKLIERDCIVFVADNFSLGKPDLLEKSINDPNMKIIEADLSKEADVDIVFKTIIKDGYEIDEVWHLAANSDIPSGVSDPNIDLKDTFLTTYEILKACNKYSVQNFNFASSSAVYGDWGSMPLIETMGPLSPISNYGAMKLASEAQISAAKEYFLKNANIFRFPNVVGSPATHGVIIDFVRKLIDSPSELKVLGNGSQRKSYLHVAELVDAMLYVSDKEIKNTKANIINIGCDDDGVTVKTIAELVVERCSPEANIIYGDEDRGWIGDVPRFRYDTSMLEGLGWAPSMTSLEAIHKAVDEIALQENF